MSKGNTSGLLHHMQYYHHEEHDHIKSSNAKMSAEASQNTKRQFPTKPKEKYLGREDIKTLFKTAVAIWTVQEAVPFSMFEKKSFHNMFKPFNKRSEEITTIDRRAMKEHLMELGRFCKEATEIEMTDRELSWTMDHWTVPNNLTYSTLTAHWIDELWELKACMLDFNVHRGRTTGKVIYNNI